MTENENVALVLGGARSGKSAFAEGLTAGYPPPWVYLATARALDDEMRARIERHRLRRGADWLTFEAPMELAGEISRAPEERPLLVDCLTLWLSNRLLAGADLTRDREELIAALKRRAAPTVLVSAEVGLSIVPENALARAFSDAAGELHQALARIAGQVFLVVAGCPVRVK